MLRRRLEQRLPTVGLHLIATNRYVEFLPKLLVSVDKYFFPTLNRHIIIYTDDSTVSRITRQHEGMKFHIIPIQHETWPYVTLKRFHYFSLFTQPLDYSFYCDVDSMFIQTVSANRLTNELMGTIHPGFIYIDEKGVITNTKGSVCTNEDSTAYIPLDENKVYFCGGFFGGPHSKFMELAAVLKQRIQTDIDHNVMAEWHDESHLNWYFWKNPPTILQFPFAQQEPLFTFYKDQCYLVFLNKTVRGGHNNFRNNAPKTVSITSKGFTLR
jgi:hypothetical protein